MLIGRPAIIAQRCEKFGLRLQEGRDYEVVNTDYDERFRDYWRAYHAMTDRKGVTAQLAKIEMRRRLTLIGAMMAGRPMSTGRAMFSSTTTCTARSTRSSSPSA